MALPPDFGPNGGLPDVTQDDKTFALLAHLSFLVAPIIGPLIVWLMKKDQSAFVGYHALQALIYQSVTVATLFAGVIVLTLASFLCPCAGIFMLPLGLMSFYGIYPAVKAYNGEWVGYLLIDRFGFPEQ